MDIRMISLLKGWSGIGNRLSREWWKHHLWKHSEYGWSPWGHGSVVDVAALD